jgi:NADH:ubiquinone oxidoreductase subunit F (NADH-binding)
MPASDLPTPDQPLSDADYHAKAFAVLSAVEQLLDRFVERRATGADLVQLEQLCGMVKATSLCGLGQSAPNPVLSTLRFFRAEYEAAIAGAAL